MPIQTQPGPSGFSVKNYEGARTFGLMDWANQINYRLRLLGAITGNKPCKFPYSSLAEQMDGLILEPVLQRQTICVFSDSDPTRSPPSTIHQMHLGDMAKTSEKLRKKGFAYRYISDPMYVYAGVKTGGYPIMGDPCLSTGKSSTWVDDRFQLVDEIVHQPQSNTVEAEALFAHLVVNLDASDDEINNDFKRWLKSYRKKIATSTRRYTPTRLSLWHKNGVLPYTDLKLWSQWSGKELQDKEILDLIFPAHGHGPVKHNLIETEKDSAEAIRSLTVNALIHAAY